MQMYRVVPKTKRGNSAVSKLYWDLAKNSTIFYDTLTKIKSWDKYISYNWK